MKGKGREEGKNWKKTRADEGRRGGEGGGRNEAW